MPLTGTGNALGDSIAVAIETLSPSMSQDQKDQLKAAWEKIATEIVNHIVANAAITGSAAVTTAPGTAPVTGSIT